MPAYFQAKEMQHPDGAKVLLAFSSEEEQAILVKFAAFRAEQDEAHRAALEGRDVRPIVVEPERRGPGRPRNVETV